MNGANMALKTEFKRIKIEHDLALKRTAARVVLGPSVMRVFVKGTRDALMPVLSGINLDQLHQISNQEAFSNWLDIQLSKVTKVVERLNSGNTRIFPGAKWGHSAKITALFIRDLVLSSRYFDDIESQRISYFLHVPIDGIVIDRLENCGVDLPFSKIKEIDTRLKFYAVQDVLTKAAKEVGVPRVWFDDNWGDRQQ
jgi:hypothetical protein